MRKLKGEAAGRTVNVQRQTGFKSNQMSLYFCRDDAAISIHASGNQIFMRTLTADLAVIGSGPAGLRGALQGAQVGKKAVIIDRLGLLGGASLHQGTIPSKTLRRAILDLTGFSHVTSAGQDGKVCQEVSIHDLMSRINRVLADEHALLHTQCEAHDIDVIYGTGRFIDAHCIEVRDGQGAACCHVLSPCTLIATGSRPRHPIAVPDDRMLFMDSDQIFRMEPLPSRLIILGGGIIGCEYATMFAALHTQVILMDRRGDILRMVDAEIRQRLKQYMQEMGVELKLGQHIQELRKSEDGQAEILLTDGERVQASRIFYSLGRIANVESLNLETVGIALDALGNIAVNALFQTTCPHIYAAGDVIGPPSLASTSMEQGRLAVRNALLLKSHHFPEFFPYGVYTIPEISSVGPTEEELQKQGIHYAVGRAEYSEVARGPIAGDTTGLVKLLFHAETLEMLAVHIIGTNATELIPLGQMAMDFRVRVDYFIDTIFNYPTFAEGFRIAALNGLSTIGTSPQPTGRATMEQALHTKNP
jgi:NAD(P) transhydrogenase